MQTEDEENKSNFNDKKGRNKFSPRTIKKPNKRPINPGNRAEEQNTGSRKKHSEQFWPRDTAQLDKDTKKRK